MDGRRVFEIASLIADCQEATASEATDVRGQVRELLLRVVAEPAGVAEVLAKDEAGLNVLYSSPDLTILNVIWAPGMTLAPHDHRMWAAIAVYAGSEENSFFKRGVERIARAGGRVAQTGDVLSLGAEAIHAVHNPQQRFTGAIHVYGGDFVNQPRSQWDPDTLLERPWDLESIRSQFAAANAEWRAQLGHDLDEVAT